jgi:hypothetical protein
VGVISVDIDGLQALANECEQLSEELAVSHHPQASGPAFQPTTAATKAVNASISAAVERLASRMSGTAAKLAQTATEYTARDTSSAEEIHTAVV